MGESQHHHETERALLRAFGNIHCCIRLLRIEKTGEPQAIPAEIDRAIAHLIAARAACTSTEEPGAPTGNDQIEAMAATARAVAAEYGACTEADLLRAGYTKAEIAALWPQASKLLHPQEEAA